MKHLRLIFQVLLSLAAIAGVVGCGGGTSSSATSSGGTTGGSTTGGSINSGAAVSVYVVQQPIIGATQPAGSILQFAATASGSTSPVATITAGLPIGQVATDQLGNIYIATSTDVREYSSGATGAASAIRIIPSGATTGIYDIDGMAISPTGSIVLGQDGGDIEEFSASQNGSVAPTRRIPGVTQTGGGLSPIIVANQVAVDASDTIYVAPQGGAPVFAKVAVFGPTAIGNTAPTRTVGGTGAVNALTVDSAGNIYTTSNISCTISGSTQVCQGLISEYAANAKSTDAPIRTISGSATLLGALYGIKVDAVGNIYVVSTSINTATSPITVNPTVLKFSATATGNVAPTASFTSTAWTAPDFNASIALH